MSPLTKIEEILLLTIWRLGDDAYGVRIRQHVSQVLDKTFTYGNLYSALNQLVKKGYVQKWSGEKTSERMGRPRIYYTISSEGFKALRAAQEMNAMLWSDVPACAFNPSCDR